MKRILHSVLALTLLVPAATIVANEQDPVIDEMIGNYTNISQADLNNATEDGKNVYSANAFNNIIKAYFPGNTVARYARKAAHTIGNVFSSSKKQAYAERQADVAAFKKFNEEQEFAAQQANSEIAHGVYEPMLEAGTIADLSEVPNPYRDVIAAERLGSLDKAIAKNVADQQPGIITRSYNTVKDATVRGYNAAKNAAIVAGIYGWIQAQNAKDYVAAEWAKAKNGGIKERSIFAVKAAVGAGLTGLVAYTIWKGARYAYKKAMGKKPARKVKKKKKIANRPQGAMAA